MNKYVSWGSVLRDTSLSSGNVNDYIVHISWKYADQDRNNSTCRPGWEEVANATN